MSSFLMLVKMNFKLLFRNKGFLFFLLLTPIASVLILNIKIDDSSEIIKKDINNEITELKSMEMRAIYNANPMTYTVKVYDASGSDLSEYVLEQFAETGIYAICRVKVPGLTEEEALKQAKTDAFSDRQGIILYLNKDFSANVIKGEYDNAIQLYNVSDDKRTEIFRSDLADTIGQMHQIAVKTSGDESQVIESLKAIDNKMPSSSEITINKANEVKLTKEQDNAKTLIGYSMAFMSLGFLFCGVCIASTVIEEQNNKVFTRIMLTKVDGFKYIMSKLVLCFFITLIQTVIMGVCLVILGNTQFIINMMSLMLLMFLLGLIFCLLSMSIGILIGDVMGANYATFAIWSISGLFAGLYFPLDSISESIKMMSKLVPQHWILKASEMLMTGDKSAYVMILCITAAYLLVISSIGVVGLRLKRED